MEVTDRMGPVSEAAVENRGWIGKAPFGTAGLVLGVASVVGNVFYNCRLTD